MSRRGSKRATGDRRGPEIVHVSPVMFGEDGEWGGGERYPLELARAQAELARTRLISFGSRPRRERLGKLELVVLVARRHYRRHKLNPLSASLVREIGDAPIIHAHQYRTALTDMLLLFGSVTGRRVYVTDHGGWGNNLGRLLPRERMLTRLLAVSGYSASLLPSLASRTTVIYGGADPSRFQPSTATRNAVVFVGRLLPHKGVDVLIEAADADMEIEIYGRPYNPGYRQTLGELARGKRVRFIEDAGNDQIVRAYQSARVAVLPSVLRSRYGASSVKAELLGLAPIEAMACATPVICSDIGPLPEVVLDGQTGFVVPAGDPEALRRRLRELLSGDELWARMSDAALRRAQNEFTWSAVARRALDAYSLDADGAR